MPNSRLQVVGEKAAWDENLRLWLESHLKGSENLSTTVLSRSGYIGVSRTALDAYLKCTYFGQVDPNTKKIRDTKNSKIEPTIRAYRARVDGPGNDSATNTFVKTIAWNQIRSAIQTAIEENSITLAYGGYGRGKTRCTREFVNTKLQTMPVMVLCSPNITPRYFLQKIASELKISIHRTTPDLEDSIIVKLTSFPRPIIIDQANYLNAKALGSIAYIWEVARTPVTLIGTQTLYDNFYSAKMTEDERAQLASRVAMQYPLSGLDLATVKAMCERLLGKEAATPQIVKMIFEKVGGKLDAGGKDELTGNFRALEFRLRRLVKLVKLNPDTPMEKLMKMADEMLMAA